MLVEHMNSELKTCRDCHIEKPLTAFTLRPETGRYRPECRACASAARRKRMDNDPLAPQKRRAHYEANRERICANARAYHVAHRGERVAAAKARYQKQLPGDLEAKARWLAANKGKMQAYYHEWYTQRSETRRAQVSAWRRANPDLVQLATERKRARKAAAPGAGLSRSEWAAIKAAFSQRCAYCLRPDDRLTQDHMQPLSRGGMHSQENIVPACRSCNSRKNASTTLEWLARGC